jgi:hypothetical protein
MFKRYWFIFIAFGLAAPAYAIDQRATSHQQEREYQNNTQADRDGKVQASFPDAPLRNETALKNVVGNSEHSQSQTAINKQNDNEIRDLLAQEQMALYAKWLFWLTLGGTIISGIGLLLLLHSVRLTRESLYQTAQANITSRGAGAVTSQIGETQTRAYLTVKRVWRAEDRQIGIGSAYFKTRKVNISIHNGGISPATDVTFFAEAKIFESPIRRRNTVFPEAPQYPPRTVIGPSLDIEFSTNSVEEFEPAKGKGFDVVVTGLIKYKDIFRKNHITKFAYQCSYRRFSGASDEVIFSPCFYNNEIK